IEHKRQCVVEASCTARPRAPYGALEQLPITRVVLTYVNTAVESDYRCLVYRPQRGVQKLDCDVLFKWQFVSDAATRVHQKNKLKRYVCLAAEMRNDLGAVVFIDGEVCLIQIRNQPASVVTDSEINIYKVHVNANYLFLRGLCR